MVKKVYPIKWDTETNKWLLEYVTSAGGTQKVFATEKVALENYLVELKKFTQSMMEKSH